jgi:hypothetical protein
VLKKHGHVKLEESILRTVGPYSTSSREDQSREGHNVPSNPSILVKSVKRKILDPGQWYNLLINFVMHNGYIWAGRLDGKAEYQGIFYFLNQEDAPPTLFTSTHLDLDNLGLPLFAYNFVVLEVEEVAGKQDVKVLRCDGKWAGGLWYAPIEAMQRCCFPWARSS